MTGPWSTCGQEPWYVDNDEAHAYSSVGLAKDGEVKAIAVWTGEHDHADEMVAALNAYRWLPIDQADKSITQVQDFSEVGITLRNSDRYWVRDEDGRVYEASWTDDKVGYWWDWEGESPADPVEFMPHPLDPRWGDASKMKGISE
jgi:hypothetical protein